MSTEFNTIGLVGRFQTREVGESLGALAAYLRTQDVNVLVDEHTASSTDIQGYEVVTIDELGKRADLVVVLGGDGTMLNAARQMAEYSVPVVGVNQGRLGFMTDISRDHMLEGVAAILEGKYTREARVLLDAEVWRSGERVFHSLAFNDVVISKGDIGRMIELEVKVDGGFLYVLRADGMIVATPTGSTAYALSANGPILHPSVRGLAIVPLCPHALSNRPITVSDESVIEVTVAAPHACRFHFDSVGRFDAESYDRIVIRRSDHVVTLIHPQGYSYFEMLREKLHWSALPRY
ncbi:MAG TPA: NAD kinase [Rhodocyclaceae bacterium]|jgi:NAD+ kinase|nr:NAD kinase [Rhodocyclaceae bacterium]